MSMVEGLSTVRITPQKQQMMGVKTAFVQKKPFCKTIRIVGKIDYAEPNIVQVYAKFEGWVDKLYVDFTGKLIQKGQPLLEVYSPDLVSTQREYLLALSFQKMMENARDSSFRSSLLLNATRQRLKFWDITDQQIEELERTKKIKKSLILNSPANGFVATKNVFEGKKLSLGESLYTIADISKVWILGEVYESDLSFVKVGQEVKINLSYYPSETFKGKIIFIYPYLDAKTRTNKIRIELENPDFRIKPEMYANLYINADYGLKLIIPKEAVLDSGKKKIVFIAKSDGYFEPREVKLGLESDEGYEVKEGIVEGEKVASSAVFLIDSESNLKAAISQMSDTYGHKGH